MKCCYIFISKSMENKVKTLIEQNNYGIRRREKDIERESKELVNLAEDIKKNNHQVIFIENIGKRLVEYQEEKRRLVNYNSQLKWILKK